MIVSVFNSTTVPTTLDSASRTPFLRSGTQEFVMGKSIRSKIKRKHRAEFRATIGDVSSLPPAGVFPPLVVRRTNLSNGAPQLLISVRQHGNSSD